MADKPAAPTKKADPKFVVIHKIKEDHIEYEPGTEYKGKFSERFLKGGQIRPRDK